MSSATTGTVSASTRIVLPIGVVLTVCAALAGIWVRDAAMPRIAGAEDALSAHEQALKDHENRLNRMEEREKAAKEQLNRIEAAVLDIQREMRQR